MGLPAACMNPVLLGETGRRIEYDNLVVGVGQRGVPRQRVMGDSSTRHCSRPHLDGANPARFGQFDGAGRELATALRIAHEAGIHESEFRIERIKAGLGDCQRAETALEGGVENSFRNDAIREVSAPIT